MIYLNKIFKIPGPKDLKMSDSNNAMPSALFPGNNFQKYTWEDYYSRVKKDYPIRYFFASTILGFIVGKFEYFKRIFSDIFYWFKCKFIKKYKYHLLDLRQPKKILLPFGNAIVKVDNSDYYNYGWIDVDSRMLYAIFGLLNEYVKHEVTFITDEDVKADPFLQKSKDLQNEILEIHHWWNVERKQQLHINSALCDKWHFLSLKNQAPGKARAWKEMQDCDQKLEEKTDEMINRLMKIRRSLWS